jgi:predicted nucleic acid-binding protein
MTPLYLDTGLVLKLIVNEPLSTTVRDHLTKHRTPIWFTRIIALEVENTLHALRFRKQLNAAEVEAARALVAQLGDEGKFVTPPLSMDAIADEMLRLAPTITAKTGCRTLDLMHVAAAKLLKAPRFISTDKRQLSAARLAGLKVTNLSP